MRTIHTEILVIGGGATGTGILRDLALRGFHALLVEQRDLTHGTTGRYHGLLHSGARYAVKDPQAARECIEENRILRKIMPQCIEDTGGFFVQTPWDEEDYAERFLTGCQAAGIPVEEIRISEMLRKEPHLNPDIQRCLRVPDGAADSFLAAHANVASARAHGAECLTYHPVQRLLTDADPAKGLDSAKHIVGALCYDLVKDEPVQIEADLVINAAGAWVGKIGATAGLEIAIRPGKGTMLAVSHRIVNTVVNRLKMPADGDILVPAHTVAVMGTTDEQVADPDSFSIEPWEVDLMLAEGEKLVPGFRDLRMLRAWAGVRPLYQETKTDQSRDITRAFVLLDHSQRDGISGLLTITSGKWTTYRKMAAATVDKVCELLGTSRPCRTHLEPLPVVDHRQPQPAGHGYHYLGERFAQIEKNKQYYGLVCECELVTQAEIETAIQQGSVHTLDDLRRDLRLGMGPCQGGFCTLRAAGILQQFSPDKNNSAVAMRDFLEERWKGLRPVLWGQQLRQERLNELIYLNVLNLDHLPGPAGSQLKAEPYAPAQSRTKPGAAGEAPQPPTGKLKLSAPAAHSLVVIGAGLAGLTAAWQAATRGWKVKVISKGWGSQYWAAGGIDVLGYYPHASEHIVDSPVGAIARLMLEQPNHPYTLAGIPRINAALREIKQLCEQAGYPLQGSLDRNWLLPTAIGAVRPTCLVPESMVAGDLEDPQPMLLVGLKSFVDFQPELAAANLQLQGYPAQALMLELPSLSGQQLTTISLARLFELPDFQAEFVAQLKPHLEAGLRLGLPAVLGTQPNLDTLRALEKQLGCRCFEIPGLPPSIPGMRLQKILVQAIRQAGGHVYEGMEVIAASVADQQVQAVWSEAAGRPMAHQAQAYVLATGGILGGGFTSQPSGQAYENIFGLPIEAPTERLEWVSTQFLEPQGHSIFQAGLQVDEQLRTPYPNLYAIGSVLAGDFLRQRALEGVALVSGFQIGEVLA